MLIFDKSKDYISIIAPASSCKDVLDKLIEVKKILTDLGFQVLIDDKIFLRSNLPFFASNKEERARMFKDSLENQQAKIIWVFRGGYGCSEFVFDCLKIQITLPKILIGYSDVTILHALLNQHYNIPTIHGSVLTSFLPPYSQNINYIIDLLSGKDSAIKLEEINSSTLTLGGKIIGGNLTVFTNLLGTYLHPKTNDKILILEDINEKAYQIHRHLIHLKNAGIFQGLKAIIFGDFTNSDLEADLAISSFCQEHIPYIPAYRAKGIGHTQVNYPIILNEEAIIEGNYLKFSSPFRLV